MVARTAPPRVVCLLGRSDMVTMIEPCFLNLDEVVQSAGASLETGLDSDQVAERRSACGFNELEKPPSKPIWKLVLEQFDDTLVKVLVLAALVSFALAISEELDALRGSHPHADASVWSLLTLDSLKACKTQLKVSKCPYAGGQRKAPEDALYQPDLTPPRKLKIAWGEKAQRGALR